MTLELEVYLLFNLLIVQFKMIFPYWIVGIFAGSLLSVFAADKIKAAASRMSGRKVNPALAILAAGLGAVSPICMYGTVPLIADLGRKGVPQYLLAAFMVTSILINPNLLIISFSLGASMAILRLALCIAAGVIAGLLAGIFFKKRILIRLDTFEKDEVCRIREKSFRAFLGSVNRGIVKTAPYFLIGIFLTAVFDRYIPKEWIFELFNGNKGLGVLFATSMGVPIYVCGGGTVPLLKAWLDAGMSPGSAVAFMISGPATKLTNLSAMKILLGIRGFSLYIAFSLVFAAIAGLAVDIVCSLIR